MSGQEGAQGLIDVVIAKTNFLFLQESMLDQQTQIAGGGNTWSIHQPSNIGL